MLSIDEILGNLGLRTATFFNQLIKEEGFCKMRGDVDLVVRNESTGKIIGRRCVRNLIVNTGLYHIADRLQDTLAESAMSYAAIGSNNTAVTATDTALAAELGRVALTSKVRGSGGNANQVTYTATVPAGTGTGTIVEAGIFNANSGGIMLARTIFSPIVKGSGDAVDLSWQTNISAA